MIDVKIDNLSDNLEEIAENVAGYVKGNSIQFPDFIGEGYYQQFFLEKDLKIVLVNCSFKKPFHFQFNPSNANKNVLIFRYINIFNDKNGKKSHIPPSVHVSTEDMRMDVNFPAGKQIKNIMVSVNADYLKQQLSYDASEHQNALQQIFSGKAFLYEEMMTPKIHAVVDELERHEGNEVFDLFFYKIKALELVYLFLDEFIKRDAIPTISINKSDIAAIYKVRSMVLQDLSINPVLPELAQIIAMSESKMKKLYKQVFGLGIYEYYQDARMKEAARLLKEENYSVSETGYALGFSNLSHFGRLFEKHFGMKPKKYSVSK